MIRRNDDKPMNTDFGEVSTTAKSFRSQVLQSRMRCRVPDDDRATYDKWRRGVSIFYGLFALLVVAILAMEHAIDAKQTMASAQPTVTSTATRTP